MRPFCIHTPCFTFPNMELPIYKMTVDEVDEGVSFVALVDQPAIERPFMAFSKQFKFTETGERRVLTGPLMLADTPIYRNDAERGEYYVVFEKPTIRKIVEKYFKQGNQHNVNAEHAIPVDGVFMFESYIIDRERGVMPPKGYDDVPDGSWFGSFKVENEEVWENRATFSGFSVEGIFGLEKENDLEVELSALCIELDLILQHLKHKSI